MSTIIDSRVGPSDLAPEEQARMEQIVMRHVRPVLLTEGGDVMELPKVLNDLLVTVIEAMRRQQAVFVLNENEAFTTQAAANFLGVSRQYLVRLLEDGKIPFHHAGTHRRVFLKDLVAFQQARTLGRRAVLDQMTETAVEAGVYDRFISPERGEDGR